MVAVDGKTMRRSFDRQGGRGPLHLISTFALRPISVRYMHAKEVRDYKEAMAGSEERRGGGRVRGNGRPH